jgi:hypothetical protein
MYCKTELLSRIKVGVCAVIAGCNWASASRKSGSPSARKPCLVLSQKERGVGAFFPADGVAVLVGSTAAILAVLCAYAVAVLGDLAGDPVFLRECANYVADQLSLADAAGVATDYDEAPILFLW